MRKRRIIPNEVVTISLDGYASNLSAHATIEKSEEVKWLRLLCFNHMASNTGKHAGLPNLKKCWSLLQKIFSFSAAAKSVYSDITGTKWVEYSDTRWYSEHEVYQNLYTKFQFLNGVFESLISRNICRKTALEAQEMLLFPKVCLLLKSEVASYVEGLIGFVRFCYNMEADEEILRICMRRILTNIY